MFVGIFARAGSKGLPNKNILPFQGGNLLTKTISQGKQFLSTLGFSGEDVYFSSDSEAYRKIANGAGAKTEYVRPDTLATDDSPELLSWQHLLSSNLNLTRFPTMVVLPVTSPLRRIEDIMNAYKLFITEKYDLVITGNQARKNPYFSMFEEGPKGMFYLSKSSNLEVYRRQDAPRVYENNNAVYVVSTKFLLQTKYLFSGRIGLSIMPELRSIDIDTKIDFELAKILSKDEINQD